MVLLSFCLSFSPALADLRITEVYPAPPEGEDEWVEVYNDGDNAVTTSDFFLEDETGKHLKWSQSHIAPRDVVIATATAVLNNGGDTVRLKDLSNEILDTYTYPSIAAGASYTRCTDHWIVSSPTKSSRDLTSCSTSTQTTTTAVPIGALVLWEVHPSPVDGAEWIELYNTTENTIELINWKIDDAVGSGGNPQILNLTIGPKSVRVVELQQSLLNNEGDNVTLIDSSGSVYDSATYPTVSKGSSFARNNGSWCVQEEATKGSVQYVCRAPTQIAISEGGAKVLGASIPRPSILPSLSALLSPKKTSSIPITYHPVARGNLKETSPEVAGISTSSAESDLPTPSISQWSLRIGAGLFALASLISYLYLRYGKKNI